MSATTLDFSRHSADVDSTQNNLSGLVWKCLRFRPNFARVFDLAQTSGRLIRYHYDMNLIDRRTRPDRVKETIVNAGIIMATVDGRAAAAMFLESEGVKFSTIVRVLDETGRRRRLTSTPDTPP